MARVTKSRFFGGVRKSAASCELGQRRAAAAAARTSSKDRGPGKEEAGGNGWPTSKKRSREPTPFQMSVYQLIKGIPPGKVSTYGLVAKALGTSPRAVGNALRHNPFAPQVPCHRVVATSLELYGFNGQCGKGAPNLAKKRSLLLEEGVRFEAAGSSTVDKACLHAF